MEKTLILFSGLPGTGKSALSLAVAQTLRIPLLSIDDIAAAVPPSMNAREGTFWEDRIHILLTLAAFQLQREFSVAVDSVFMGDDRNRAAEIAEEQKAAFRPIYTFLSDERMWAERVRKRAEAAPVDRRGQMATWATIQEQRKIFHPWVPGSALFVDGVNSLETNIEAILKYVAATD